MEIEARSACYRYDMPDSPWAVRDVDLHIGQGEKIAITGPAGSGKTTLIQMCDALILPTRGDMLFDGTSVKRLAKARKLTTLRRRMGVLFQFPEHQFFQETAYDELAFAMRNFFNPDEKLIEQRSRETLEFFQMDLDQLRTVSPFNLSSGEKRKLALASALMLKPEVLILDEPTAGMDATGRRELLRLIATLERTTVILITHNLEDFLGIADRIIGMVDGRKVLDIERRAIPEHIDAMQAFGMAPPLVMQVQAWLRKQGMVLDSLVYDMADLVAYLASQKSAPENCP